MEYQKKIVSESEIDQEWQKIIVNDCKTLEPLRFRCKLDAALKLDADLSLENIKSNNLEYALSSNLNLAFKEVKVVS